MLHLVCLLHRQGSQELCLLHQVLHLFVLRMDFASSAANQDIFLETVVRTRTAEMVVATLRPATLKVVMHTTSTLKQLRSSPLL